MENQILQASACAKFILCGEHSIVTRGRAVAIPLPQLRLHVKIHLGSESQENVPDERLKKVIDFFHKQSKFKDLKFQGLEIQSQIPQSSGLGSSAALCVALARALLPDKTDFSEMRKLCTEAECFFHTRSSGLDPTVSLLESTSFQNAVIYQPRHQETFRYLDLSLFYREGYFFALLPTGSEHQTGEVIKAVSRVREATPLLFEDLMNSLASNAEELIKAFQESRFLRIPQILEDSQFRLMSLGVSNPETDEILDQLRVSPFYRGAKITGAGCGGYVLGLFQCSDREEREELKKSLVNDFAPKGNLFFHPPELA